ncbi:MAG: anti-sigma factor family protein [Anaerolineales bacterium]
MEGKECQHLLGSLSEYIDGELGDELCAEIERHLNECDNCRVVVDSLNKTVYLYQTTSQNLDVPAGLRERLFRRLNLDEYLEGK